MEARDMKGWILILALALGFLAWGFFVFLTVGDKGPPPWDFGVVKDLPSESPYSTEPPSKAKEVRPQHVHK